MEPQNPAPSSSSWWTRRGIPGTVKVLDAYLFAGVLAVAVILVFGPIRLHLGGMRLLSLRSPDKVALWWGVALVLRGFLGHRRPFSFPVWSEAWVERRAWWLLLGVVLFGAGLTVPSLNLYALDSDTYGYLSEARAILSQQVVEEEDVFTPLGLEPVRMVTVPLAHLQAPDGIRRVPKYPVGWPLHLAFLALTMGHEWGPFHGPTLVSLLLLVATFLAGREIFGARAGLVGALLLVGSTAWQQAGMLLMSDGCASLWIVVSFLALLRSGRHPSWGLAAGLAVGIAVLTRPQLALVVPLYAAYLLATRRVRACLCLVLGGLPPAVFLALWSRQVYGGLFGSGHGPTADLFRTTQLLSHARFYAGDLLRRHGYLPAAWALLGLLWGRRGWRVRGLLGLLFLQNFLLHCLYWPGGDWTSGRYFLPWLWATALLAGQGLVVASGLVRRPWRAPVAALLTLSLLGSAGAGMMADRRRSYLPDWWKVSEERYQDTVQVDALVEPDAVVFAFLHSGMLRLYCRRKSLNWNVRAGLFRAAVDRLRERDVPLYLLHFKHFPCHQLDHFPEEFELILETPGESHLYRILPRD